MSEENYIISSPENKGWIHTKYITNLDEVIENLVNYDVGLFDMDSTLAKRPTINSIIYDMIINIKEKDDKFKWILNASKDILREGHDAYSKLFYEYNKQVIKLNSERREKILEHNRKHPFKTFPGVKNFFNEFIDRYNILLTQSTPEIAEGMKLMYVKNGNKLRPFSEIICEREKYKAVEKILDNIYNNINLSDPKILVVGDSKRDKEVKETVEDIVGKDNCISIKVCKTKKDIDDEFNLSISQNWNSLIQVINEYSQRNINQKKY